jgi:hypothetical protein
MTSVWTMRAATVAGLVVGGAGIAVRAGYRRARVAG